MPARSLSLSLCEFRSISSFLPVWLNGVLTASTGWRCEVVPRVLNDFRIQAKNRWERHAILTDRRHSHSAFDVAISPLSHLESGMLITITREIWLQGARLMSHRVSSLAVDSDFRCCILGSNEQQHFSPSGRWKEMGVRYVRALLC